MSPIKKAFVLAFSFSLLLTACQQKQNKRVDLRSGRGLRGSTTIGNGNAAATSVQQCGGYAVAGKYWGEVTSYQGDQQFMQELQILTSPVMRTLPQEDQLGYVSGTSGQYTGVRFWGNVALINGYTLDPSSAQIRIEIFDDRACQVKSDGTVRPVIPIHIGAGLPDFVNAEGYVSGGNARLVFTDKYGSIIMQGQISGNSFQGVMSYTLVEGGGQTRDLGRFNIPVAGMFQGFYGM